MQTDFQRISISDFRKTFAGKPPCANTIKKWIITNEVQGEILGSLYFLHLDHDGHLIPNNHQSKVDNILLAKLIGDFENDSRSKAKNN